jgi:hypothetical protein
MFVRETLKEDELQEVEEETAATVAAAAATTTRVAMEPAMATVASRAPTARDLGGTS